jgi:anti-sigma factor RsiW
MSEHLCRGDFELYVIDGLDAARAAEVEAHVVACEACGAKLANEAALEIAFEQVARVAVPVVGPTAAERVRLRPRPMTGLAVVTAGALSMAAAWMLFLLPVSHGSPRANLSRTSNGGYGATPNDATPAALDGRSLDPLDGG